MESNIVAWAAGFFEGEGTVVVYRNTGYVGLRGMVRAVQKEKEALEVLQKTFSGSLHFQQNPHGGIWQWSITGLSSCTFLEKIIPHIRNRRKRLRAKMYVYIFSTKDLETREALFVLWRRMSESMHKKEI